jgi:hypothetical protein
MDLGRCLAIVTRRILGVAATVALKVRSFSLLITDLADDIFADTFGNGGVAYEGYGAHR